MFRGSGSGGTRTGHHRCGGRISRSKREWSAVAYRAVSAQGRSRTGNRAGLSRAALPVGVPRRVVPDGLEPSFPGCRPGVVAAGPRDSVFRSGSRETRTRNGVTRTCFRDRLLIRPDDFRKVPGVGIEPTPSWFRARRHYQQQLPRSVVRVASITWSEARGEGFEPSSPASKAGGLPLADPQVNLQGALRESNSPIQRGRLAPLPLGQEHGMQSDRRQRSEVSRIGAAILLTSNPERMSDLCPLSSGNQGGRGGS